MKKDENFRVNIGSIYIKVSVSIKVSSRCKSCYFPIRSTGVIRKHINKETCDTLVQVVFCYRPGCANAYFFDVSVSLINHDGEYRTVLHDW